jgi:hypothetical protein
LNNPMLPITPPGTDEPHPLSSLEVCSGDSWSEWLRKWEEAQGDYDTLMGLLHSAFSIRMNDRDLQAHRLCWFLLHADGFERKTTFSSNQGDQTRISSAQMRTNKDREELRQALAAKAFEVLCREFFGLTNHRGEDVGLPGWTYALQLPGVLDMTVWFLRPSKYGSCSNMSYPEKKHLEVVMRRFADQLWRQSWLYAGGQITGQGYWRELSGVAELTHHQALIDARPRLLHIPFALSRHMDLVTDHLTYPLDSGSMSWLADQAMMPRRSGFGDVTPATMEEAFYLGSRNAGVVLLLRVLNAEVRRANEALVLEEKIRSAETDLARLRGTSRTS